MFLNSTLVGFPGFRNLQTAFGKNPKSLACSLFFPKTKRQYSMSLMKPPNIMIYTGSESIEDILFKKSKERLSKLVNSDCYVFYQLITQQIRNGDPWQDNTTLLVVNCKSILPDISSAFTEYFEKGGRLLSFSSNLQLNGVNIELETYVDQDIMIKYKTWHQEITLKRSPYKMTNTSKKCVILARNYDNEPVIIETKNDTKSCIGKAVLSQVNLLDSEDSSQILRDLLSEHFNLNCYQETTDDKISVGYLLTNNIYSLIHFKGCVGNELYLKLKNSEVQFCDRVKEDAVLCSSQYHIVLNGPTPLTSEKVRFSKEKYFFYLKTTKLGQVVIFSNVVNSTMDLVEGLKDDFGLVVISRKQLGGKGRGGNKWLSPEGCAMFSFQIQVPIASMLGQAIPFLQHLVALAVVHSVRSRPGYENLDLRLKWPNDIYVSKSSKIGGILVSSTITGNLMDCVIGCGINLDNVFPTLCINRLIDEYNMKEQLGPDLEKISLESFIANTFNCLEQLIKDFQKHGAESCLTLYYQYWIHSDQQLMIGETGEMVRVCGLDQFGYLTVRHSNEVVSSLQPDGNSLDMMKNLIRIKN